MSAELASYFLFGAWYVTWWIPALWSAKVAKRPAPSADVTDRALAGIGAVLLFFVPVAGPPGGSWLQAHLWAEPAILGWALVGCMVAAFAFCWWARLHLGRLWSGLVTTKEGHRIVDTGPYRLVRHPIYTGVIAAAACVGLIKATPVSLVGAVAMAIGFWLTARKEERFLRQELGEAAYDAYSRRTPMLIPFLGRGTTLS
jgi:protein-S-isoprenylcysteine O-methyltransferase Ste14